MSLPYESATAGEKALSEAQKILAQFGCQSFGVMTDNEDKKTIVQFKWRNRRVSLEASWAGYATAYLRRHPYNPSRCRRDLREHEARALEQAKISVCSVLRDWIKGQVTAVECGIMSFEAAFMPHMLTNDGQRVIDRIAGLKMLPQPEGSDE